MTDKITTKKYNNLFDTEHLKHDLKNKSIQGGISTMAGESISLALRIGSMVVLARILMPEHFGLIAMVMALTDIVERFKDFGLSSATVQRKEINHEQVSTLFWINLGIGILIMLSVAALSQVIVWFYKDRRLFGITLALSSSFLFGGLAVQHHALLRRQMRFNILAWINILSNTLSIALAIALAWQGYGYWALVWKEVSRAVFIAAGLWLMCRWRPSFPKRIPGIGSMLRFGRDITGFNITHFFSQSLDKILIGKFWGAGPLGFYKEAYQLINLPIKQIQFSSDYVSESTLSTLQNEYDKYRRYYKKIISILSFAYMPLVTYICIFSENIILLILGKKWIESAAICRILAIAAFILPVANTCGTVMITCGKTKRYLWWGVMNATCVSIAFFIGVKWGTIGVAIAYVVNTYVILIPSLWYCFRNTPVSISLFLQAISLPILSSIMMGALLILCFQNIGPLSNFVEIILSLLLTPFIYSGVWLLLPGGKKKLIEYFSYPLTTFKLVPSFMKKNVKESSI